MYQMTMNVDAVDAAKRLLLGEVRLVKNRHGMYMAIDVTRRSVLASSTSPERIIRWLLRTAQRRVQRMKGGGVSRQKKKTKKTKKTIENKNQHRRRHKSGTTRESTSTSIQSILKLSSSEKRQKFPTLATKLQLQVLHADPRMFEYASDAIKSDKDIVRKVAKHIPWDAVLEFASSSICSDRDIVMEAVKKDGGALEYASETLRDDRAIVMEAVKNAAGVVLQYASNTLQGDRAIVMAAVKQNPYALQYASNELRDDRQVVMEAVRNSGPVLDYASGALKGDRGIVMAAVKQNGYALKYASETLRGDRQIVMEAVKEFGHALEYASEELRNDREIVMCAVKSNGDALTYASDRLRGDRDIVTTAVTTAETDRAGQGADVLDSASIALQKDDAIRRLAKLEAHDSKDGGPKEWKRIVLGMKPKGLQERPPWPTKLGCAKHGVKHLLLECAGNQCQGDNPCGEMDCDVCGMEYQLGRDSYFWLRCQACGYMVCDECIEKKDPLPYSFEGFTPTGKCDIERPGGSICSQNNDNEKCFGRFRGCCAKELTYW